MTKGRSDKVVTLLLSGEPRLDLRFESREIDRLRQQGVRSPLESHPSGVGVAISRDHQDRQGWMLSLDARQKIQPAHSWHVDVREHEVALVLRLHRLQGFVAGLLEAQIEAAVAQFAAELLPEQHLDVALVVDDENPDRHGLSSSAISTGRKAS